MVGMEQYVQKAGEGATCNVQVKPSIMVVDGMKEEPELPFSGNSIGRMFVCDHHHLQCT